LYYTQTKKLMLAIILIITIGLASIPIATADEMLDCRKSVAIHDVDMKYFYCGGNGNCVLGTDVDVITSCPDKFKVFVMVACKAYVKYSHGLSQGSNNINAMPSIGMANNYVSGAETIPIEVIWPMGIQSSASVKLTNYSCKLVMVDVALQK